MEVEVTLKSLKDFNLWNLVILIAIGIIIFNLIIISNEIYSAKESCLEMDGEYSLSLFKMNHYCNDKPFYKYHGGNWFYDMTLNTSSLLN